MEKFERWLILKQVEPIIYGRKKIKRVQCQCDCGNIRVVNFRDIKNNKSKSCGCLHKEIVKEYQYKHGDTTLNGKRNIRLEYNSWISMKQRCNNPKSHKYKDYGERGIKVCDRWINSYSNFLEDMGRRPTPLHSIDRINVNGNYEPTNCRWSNSKEQANNKRNNKDR